MTNKIHYKTGNDLNLDQFIDLYISSTLGERRPVDNRDYMEKMLNEANLVITAWEGDLLVGISRSFTDWGYIAYLADLAVRLSHQHMGIGKELLIRTRAALKPEATVILIAAPAATEYYPKIGMKPHDSAWILRPGDQLISD